MVKGLTELKGLRATRTIQGSRKRSMPRVKSSTYLDLFILVKEKDRLEKELTMMEKRKESLREKLKEIAVESKKLLAAKSREKPTPPDKRRANIREKMTMTY